MSAFWHEVNALARKVPCALTTIVGVRGSAPRHVGARMLVGGDGQLVATVGGGRLEWELVQRAQKAVVTHTGGIHRIHLVRELAMCCGGSIEAVITPLDHPAQDVIAHVAAMLDQRQTICLATARDGSGLAYGPHDDATHFCELLEPPPRAFVFGAGHVSRALVPLLRTIGYWVIVCDDDDGDGPLLVADAHVTSFALRDVEAVYGPFVPRDVALIVTRDHAVDQSIIEAALVHAWGYLGLIGSHSKRTRFRQRLEAKGLALDAWDRVHCPVGLDIGAETPEEIAVAIAADVIRVRRAGASRGGATK